MAHLRTVTDILTDAQGVALAGHTITFSPTQAGLLVAEVGGQGRVVAPLTVTATTDTNGRFTADLIPSAAYIPETMYEAVWTYTHQGRTVQKRLYIEVEDRDGQTLYGIVAAAVTRRATIPTGSVVPSMLAAANGAATGLVPSAAGDQFRWVAGEGTGGEISEQTVYEWLTRFIAQTGVTGIEVTTDPADRTIRWALTAPIVANPDSPATGQLTKLGVGAATYTVTATVDDGTITLDSLQTGLLLATVRDAAHADNEHLVTEAAARTAIDAARAWTAITGAPHIPTIDHEIGTFSVPSSGNPNNLQPGELIFVNQNSAANRFLYFRPPADYEDWIGFHWQSGFELTIGGAVVTLDDHQTLGAPGKTGAEYRGHYSFSGALPQQGATGVKVRVVGDVPAEQDFDRRVDGRLRIHDLRGVTVTHNSEFGRSDYSGTADPPITDQRNGQAVIWVAPATNLGAATLQVSGLTARNLAHMGDGSVMAAGDIENTGVYLSVYKDHEWYTMGVAAEALPALVSQAEARAGTVTEARLWSPERVKEAIDALADSPQDELQAIVDILSQGRKLTRTWSNTGLSSTEGEATISTGNSKTNDNFQSANELALDGDNATEIAWILAADAGTVVLCTDGSRFLVFNCLGGRALTGADTYALHFNDDDVIYKSGLTDYDTGWDTTTDGGSIYIIPRHVLESELADYVRADGSNVTAGLIEAIQGSNEDESLGNFTRVISGQEPQGDNRLGFTSNQINLSVAADSNYQSASSNTNDAKLWRAFKERAWVRFGNGYEVQINSLTERYISQTRAQYQINDWTVISDSSISVPSLNQTTTVTIIGEDVHRGQLTFTSFRENAPSSAHQYPRSSGGQDPDTVWETPHETVASNETDKNLVTSGAVRKAINDLRIPQSDYTRNLTNTAITGSYQTLVTSTAITPRSSASKFAVFVAGVAGSLPNNWLVNTSGAKVAGSMARGNIKLQRKIGTGSWTDLVEKNYFFLAAYGNPPYHYGPYEDSPATASAVQYRAQLSRATSGDHGGAWTSENIFMELKEVV